MISEFFVGLKVGATLSGVFDNAFRSARSAMDDLRKGSLRLSDAQKDLAANVERARQAFAALDMPRLERQHRQLESSLGRLTRQHEAWQASLRRGRALQSALNLQESRRIELMASVRLNAVIRLAEEKVERQRRDQDKTQREMPPADWQRPAPHGGKKGERKSGDKGDASADAPRAPSAHPTSLSLSKLRLPTRQELIQAADFIHKAGNAVADLSGKAHGLLSEGAGRKLFDQLHGKINARLGGKLPSVDKILSGLKTTESVAKAVAKGGELAGKWLRGMDGTGGGFKLPSLQLSGFKPKMPTRQDLIAAADFAQKAGGKVADLSGKAHGLLSEGQGRKVFELLHGKINARLGGKLPSVDKILSGLKTTESVAKAVAKGGELAGKWLRGMPDDKATPGSAVSKSKKTNSKTKPGSSVPKSKKPDAKTKPGSSVPKSKKPDAKTKPGSSIPKSKKPDAKTKPGSSVPKSKKPDAKTKPGSSVPKSKKPDAKTKPGSSVTKSKKPDAKTQSAPSKDKRKGAPPRKPENKGRGKRSDSKPDIKPGSTASSWLDKSVYGTAKLKKLSETSEKLTGGAAKALRTDSGRKAYEAARAKLNPMLGNRLPDTDKALEWLDKANEYSETAADYLGRGNSALNRFRKTKGSMPKRLLAAGISFLKDDAEDEGERKPKGKQDGKAGDKKGKGKAGKTEERAKPTTRRAGKGEAKPASEGRAAKPTAKGVEKTASASKRAAPPKPKAAVKPAAARALKPGAALKESGAMKALRQTEGALAGGKSLKSALSAGKVVKGAMKKLGVVGDVVGLASDLADIHQSKMSAQAKSAAYGKAIGGTVGSMAGGAAGAAIGSFLGPVGTIVGQQLGSWVGQKGGEMLGEYIGKSLAKPDKPAAAVKKTQAKPLALVKPVAAPKPVPTAKPVATAKAAKAPAAKPASRRPAAQMEVAARAREQAQRLQRAQQPSGKGAKPAGGAVFNITFSPHITVSGGQGAGVKQQVQQAMQLSFAEFERLMKRYESDRMRRNYAGRG
ncbi:hypothetical protein [Chromobacterium sp. IIBBL 290-4]|uniref:hypothetical protein n=1 Tax=Chromobacterium sp. IIBBL 290-4 TaxID=2953890 RepID=UPI0020B7369E|nr:hypothetical protein [Chromobacterium sp. IIBBL 290-4]UTH76088.1 hypothetical protein NKT35_08300 [Chromobacterium sp. IIBBL 290-4]